MAGLANWEEAAGDTDRILGARCGSLQGCCIERELGKKAGVVHGKREDGDPLSLAPQKELRCLHVRI